MPGTSLGVRCGATSFIELLDLRRRSGRVDFGHELINEIPGRDQRAWEVRVFLKDSAGGRSSWKIGGSEVRGYGFVEFEDVDSKIIGYGLRGFGRFEVRGYDFQVYAAFFSGGSKECRR